MSSNTNLATLNVSSSSDDILSFLYVRPRGAVYVPAWLCAAMSTRHRSSAIAAATTISGSSASSTSMCSGVMFLSM